MTCIPYANRYQLQIVDEWRQCYLNYSQLKLYVNIIKDCNRQSIFLVEQQKMQQKRSIAQQKQNILSFILRRQVTSFKKELIDLRKQQLRKIASDVHQMFVECYQKNIILHCDFVSFKYAQIMHNFHVCRNFYFTSKPQQFELMRKKYRVYLQYLYVESHFLSSMVRSNTQAQTRILQKHRLFSYTLFPTPDPVNNKCLKIQKYNLLKRQIQTFYVQTNKKGMNESRERIVRISQQVQFNKHIESLFIGLLSGVLVTIIIFMCIILARQHIVLEVDPIFNQHFPLWRGISTFIFYIWMLGINILFFQKYKISHKIILENEFTKYPKSNDLFKVASFFSVVFIILFVIYALQLADLLETYQMSPEWLPLYAWGLFVLFLVNPFPIFASGRVYVFKMLLKVFTSIFGQANFLTEVAVIQLFALITAFQDSVYTICFYTNLKLPLSYQQEKQEDVCKAPASIAKFAFTIFLYFLRIWHCTRNLYKFWGLNPLYKNRDFLNIVKYLTSVTTTVLSFLWRDANNSQILPAWIVFAAISTIYSFLWDWKMSFDLLKVKAKHFLLRDQIVFPKANYYIWIVLTFLLRISWTLYISPNISKSFLGSPQIFSLTFGYLQIIRRGIWNIIKVQLEQVRNRQVFRAVPKQKQLIEEQMYDYVEKNRNVGNQSAEELEAVNEEGEMSASESTRKTKNTEQKKRIVEAARQLFEFELCEKIRAQDYQNVVKTRIRELSKKVYD